MILVSHCFITGMTLWLDIYNFHQASLSHGVSNPPSLGSIITMLADMVFNFFVYSLNMMLEMSKLGESTFTYHENFILDLIMHTLLMAYYASFE